MLVPPAQIFARDAWILRSVRVSKADVALHTQATNLSPLDRHHNTSSSRTIAGDFSIVRAMATLCFSPPLSLRPRSPTTVLYPMPLRKKLNCFHWAYNYLYLQEGLGFFRVCQPLLKPIRLLHRSLWRFRSEHCT